MDLMKQTYINCAKGLNLGNFTNVSTGKERTALITKISDMYCEATDSGNELVRSQTISALMLLFWGEISKMQAKCKAVQTYEYEDFAAKLYECISAAMEYRAWQDGSTTAEACIRKLIASRGAPAILYESNLDKNKANVNNYSLDVELDDDSSTTRLDTVEDPDSDKIHGDLAVISMIQTVLNKGDLIGGIVLDNIAFNDCEKYTKKMKTGIETITDEDGNVVDEKEYKYSVGSTEFSERILVKTLSELPDDYKEYFISKYKVNENAIEAAINRIKTVDNTKLYKLVRATLSSAAYLAAN